MKLPDDSILTIDPFGKNSERYIPSSNTWIDDGVVPTSLYDPFGFELVRHFCCRTAGHSFSGLDWHTAYYTPERKHESGDMDGRTKYSQQPGHA